MNFDKAYIFICIFLFTGNLIKRIWQLGRLHESKEKTLSSETTNEELMNDIIIFMVLIILGISRWWAFR